MNEMQTTIASAVEEQTATTRAIARCVSDVSQGTTQITEHISTQLFGEPDRLRDNWDVSLDQARFRLRRIFPEFETIYAAKGWRMLPSLDRVYVNAAARRDLGWRPKHDFARTLDCLAKGEDFRSELARTVGSKGYHRESAPR